MSRQKIKDSTVFVRDNGAIINTNEAEYQKRLKIIERNKEIDDTKERLKKLEEAHQNLLKILAEPEVMAVIKRLADK